MSITAVCYVRENNSEIIDQTYKNMQFSKKTDCNKISRNANDGQKPRFSGKNLAVTDNSDIVHQHAAIILGISMTKNCTQK